MAGNSMMAVRSKSDGWRVYQLQMSSESHLMHMQKDVCRKNVALYTWLGGHHPGIKLPSSGQVLSVFVRNYLNLKKERAESAKVVVEEALVFWDKARIPTQRQDKILAKVQALHDRWKGMKKNQGRQTQTQRTNEDSGPSAHQDERQDGSYVLTEVAKSLGYDLLELNMSRASVKRYRDRYRAEKGSDLKEGFKETGETCVVR
ncbi:hypothetical protein GWK47_018069 [Chionoecetes opilio]|uniref:Uncharacterized protein n=1 Tax=Chionoecetes opilio TaxID=41210 RepID=A0A8J5BY53_CHIOP|nr:hypothetical protein GWK47_018069 [Chionoecetes opilio]